jgi:hypothetical protein
MEDTQELPLLVAKAGPLDGRRWPLSTPIVIGRGANCDIVIDDRQVSRFHARLTPTWKPNRQSGCFTRWGCNSSILDPTINLFYIRCHSISFRISRSKHTYKIRCTLPAGLGIEPTIGSAAFRITISFVAYPVSANRPGGYKAGINLVCVGR